MLLLSAKKIKILEKNLRRSEAKPEVNHHKKKKPSCLPHSLGNKHRRAGEAKESAHGGGRRSSHARVYYRARACVVRRETETERDRE